MLTTLALLRRVSPARAVALLVAVVMAWSLLAAAPASADSADPAFGLLGPTSSQVSALSGSDVTWVSLPAGWDQLEPGQNVFNNSLLNQLGSQLTSLRQSGFHVVLDLGLQYPPSWVFGLPGQTRFVNQYGDVWQGSLSEDVPNAVFNTAVRNAEQVYINRLAKVLGPTNVSGVRIGGLLSGELRYPPNTYNGHTDLIWDYDSAAQAKAPVPGWAPGTGTASQIRSSLNYYFNGLTSYEKWQMTVVNNVFPGVDQLVMLPGWGLRPGMVDDAVSTGMTNQSIAEVNGMIASGLDWDRQVKAIADAGVYGTVYTTWLDAPTQSNDADGMAPVDYLATLATKYGLPLAGENTGAGGTDALNLCEQRAEADHLTAMFYMSGDMVANGYAGVSVNDLMAAAASLRQ